jgi:ring-1,2-phenylacetyl-CoA epoxidase subunit PaaC
LSTYQLLEYTLHLADNTLILGQRNAEWCGHGPVLEQDIAITNISLDLVGAARNLFQYATEQYNAFSESERSSVETLVPKAWKEFGREMQEDDLAFLREERQYRNWLIAELPRGDWAQTILRQFFVSAFQHAQYTQLLGHPDTTLAGIAEKSLKEVAYHLRWSSEWVIRLGDGTDESRRRVESALKNLWPFTGEFFTAEPYETNDPSMLRNEWQAKVESVFSEAGLDLPKSTWSQTGGKRGIHTEHMGFLLTELQYMQRTYPNMTW